MKVYLDRNHCPVHQAACDSCFGGKIEMFFSGVVNLDDFRVTGCVLKLEEEENLDEITFYIKDRDGEDKVLIVNQENWPDAYNSWVDLYEKQQANLIAGQSI